MRKKSLYENVFNEILKDLSGMSIIYESDREATFKYYENSYLKSTVSENRTRLQLITDVLKVLEKKDLISIISYANHTLEEFISLGQLPSSIGEKEFNDYLENAKPTPDFIIRISKAIQDYNFENNEGMPSSGQKKDFNEVALSLEMVDTSLMLNKIFVIAKPNYGSENSKIINYLLENPNRDVSISELKEKLELYKIKELSKVVENLNFKGDLKKVFIKVNKTVINLRNPILQSDLDSLGINKLSLFSSKVD